MVSGRSSTRGSASSMKWTAAKLLDTVAQRGVDGERDYGEGAAAVASAMARESEGEELVSAGSGRGRGVDPRHQLDEGSGEAAGSCMARMLCSPSSSCLPAWPSQAARWSGGRARPAGGPAGWRQVRLSLLFMFFLIFCRFVAFLKIPRQLQKSPICTWSLVGIFPAWNILVWDYLSI